MAETLTNRGKTQILNGDTPLDTSDLRMLVFTGTQTGTNDPDLNFVADLDAVASVAIHAERIALTGETVTENDTDNRADADANDVVFAAAAGVTAQGVAIYRHVTNDADSVLLTIHTTNFPQAMDSGLTVTINHWLRAS